MVGVEGLEPPTSWV